MRSKKLIPSFSLSLFYLATLMVVFSSFFILSTARAQDDGGSSYGNELGLFLGNMLPNQIDGVTEIVPVFGGRFGIPSGAGVLELGGANTHAQGVDFTTFEFSFRGEVPALEGISAIVYAGGDVNWYIPQGSTERQTETGIHFGTGAMMLVADTLWLRSELKFMGGPGTSLFLLFGLTFRGGGGEGGG